MKEIWTLVKKDLRLHGCAFLLSVALLSGIAFVIVLAMPRKELEARYPVAFNLGVAASILYGQWLIDREKSRRTLAWLRSMPLSDAVLVGSKIVTLCAFQGVLFVLLLSLCAPDALLRLGPLDVAQKALAMMVFATWLLCGKWLLGERLGQAVAGLAFLLVFGLALYLSSRAGAETIFGPLLPSLLALALALLAPWLVLVAVLSRSDTSRWVR